MGGTIERILERSQKTRKSGKGWQARCPAREGKSASLSVDVARGGRHRS